MNLIKDNQKIFFCLSTVCTFVFFKQLYQNPSPDSFVATISTFTTLSYPLWRRKNNDYSLMKQLMISSIASYWFHEAYFRISNSIIISFHYYVHPTFHVSSTKAFFAAIPFILISFVFFLDELFIKRKDILNKAKFKYMYDE